MLDTANVRLFREGDSVSSDDKVIHALQLLCEHYPEAVDKDLLHEKLWPEQVVSDWSVSRLISDIRQILGDSGKAQGYIKTVRGQGFRMNTPVTVTLDKVSPPQQKPVSVLKNLKIALSILASCVVIYSAIQFSGVNDSHQADTLLPSTRIAVLPVINHIDSSPHDWVKYGVMALVSEQLSQYPSIQVLPVERVIAADVDSGEPDFAKVCGQLGCAQMVSLSFTLQDKLPQLSYALVSEQGVSSTRAFAGQDVLDATNQLLESLAASLIPQEQDILPLDSTLSTNPKANRDYAIGVHELFDGEYKDAQRYLSMALEREPDFFWANAYLADLTYRQGELEQATTAINKLTALPLDDAKQYFLENIRSNILYSKGDLQASLEVSLSLKQNPHVSSDPLLLANQSLNAGSSLQALGQLEASIPQLEDAREYYQLAGFGSGEGRVLFNLANVYLTKSEPQRAISLYQQAKDVFVRFGLTGYALLARHSLATTRMQIGHMQNVETELEQIVRAYQQNGDREGEFTAQNDLVLAKLVQGDYTDAASAAEQTYSALAATEFSYLKNNVIYLGAKAYLMQQNADKAQAMLDKLAGEWQDPRPAFAFIPIHLTLVRHQFELAISQANALKLSMKDQWTQAHEDVFTHFIDVAQRQDLTALDY